MLRIDESFMTRIGIAGNREPAVVNDLPAEAAALDMIKAELQKKFGMTGNESRVFLYLCKRGPQRAGDVAKTLATNRSETYNVLSSLQSKGLVTATLEHPVKFVATSLDKALSTLIQIQKMRITEAEDTSRYLSDLWVSIPKDESEDELDEKFQVLSGVNQICNKALQLSLTLQSSLETVLSEIDISRLQLFGFLDELGRVRSRGVTTRILATSEILDPELKVSLSGCELRRIPVDLSTLPRFIMCDGEVLLFMNSEKSQRKQLRALWTNSTVFSQAMKILFNQVWTRVGTGIYNQQVAARPTF
ncbi:MAG: hypothetical protein HYU39_08725 [Thaumarchaeota archaeon]|nr:hypothetical protein [Nitrososphaerota archaeon]